MTLNQIKDPDVRILAGCSATLHTDYADIDESWQGSPFAWIKTRPSRQVGAIGEKLVSGWLATKGFDVTRSPDSEADRIINGKRVEIKFSTLWKTGLYKFQQIRDQNYEFAILLGVAPFDAHCWVIPKKVLLDQWHNGQGMTPQHGGRAGKDTAWLSVTPGNPPEWLKRHGGPLRQARKCIASLTGVEPL